MAPRQQDPADSTNSAGQAPVTSSSAEQAPAETTPPVGKAPASTAKGTSNAGSASTTKKRRNRTVPVPAPDGGPRKIVVREGGAKEPTAQIVPGMSPAEATRQRQNAERLLGSTDERLNQLAGRTLNAHQQETVGQIRNYTVGARSALKEGDVQRASTLAEKAHLLAEDLGKHSGLGEAH